MIEDAPTMEAEHAISLDGLSVGIDHLEGIVVFLIGSSHVFASWKREGLDLRVTQLSDALKRVIDAVSALDIEPAGQALGPVAMLESSRHVTVVHRLRSFGVCVLFGRDVPLGFARMAARQIVGKLDAELPAQRERVLVETAHEPSPPSSIPSPAPSVAPSASSVPAPASSVPTPATAVAGPASSAPPPATQAVPSRFDAEVVPDTQEPIAGAAERVRALVAHLEAHAADPHIVRLRLALRSGLGTEAFLRPEFLGADALLMVETAAEDILGLEHGQLGTLGHSAERQSAAGDVPRRAS